MKSPLSLLLFHRAFAAVKRDPSRAARPPARENHAATRKTNRASALLKILILLTFSLAHPAGADPDPKPFDESHPAQEAASRAIQVNHLDLDIKINLAEGKVAGTATYSGTLRHATETLILQGVDLTISSAQWLGKDTKPASFQQDGDDLRFALPHTEAGSVWQLQIVYSAAPQQGLYFVRPDVDEPSRPLHAFTQGETELARYWLPCPDNPDQRLTWNLTVTAPAGGVVLSNGKQLGLQGNKGLQTARFQWAKPAPIYLLNLAIGPFQKVEHPHESIPTATWVLAGQKDDVARSFTKLPAMIDFFGKRLGMAYPWGTYSQVVVHEFAFGGMENVSFTTLTERSIPDEKSLLDWQPDNLLAHELAHQWFGDWVTCRSWSDSWLNEGFASFATMLWNEFDGGSDRYYEHLAGARSAYFAESHDYQRAISTERFADADFMFDRHTYNKGALVLHMLRRKLGDVSFFNGISKYLHQHGPGSVETADLRKALETASGLPLRTFFKRWVEQAGHPAITATVKYDAEQKRLQVSLEQTQNVAPGQPLFELPIVFIVRQKADSPPIRQVYRLKTHKGEWSFAASERPAVLEIDPLAEMLVEWNLQAGPDDLAAMRDLGSTADVRLRAVNDLAKDLTQQRGVAALVRALASDSARHVRAAAASALGRGERATSVQPLLQATKTDKESSVRVAAVLALGELHDATNWPILEQIAQQDQSDEVRRSALRALFTIDRLKSRDLLLLATKWPSFRDNTRLQALQLLARIGDAQDKPLFLQAARPGEHKYVRETGVIALATFGAQTPTDKDKIRAELEGYLHESNLRLRGAAAEGLGVLSEPASRGALMAAAARETFLRTAQNMRKIAGDLGRHTPLEERVKQLELQLEKLQREEHKAQGK